MAGFNYENTPGTEEQPLRIVQEMVNGKEITLAHIMAAPMPIIYQKLGLNPNIDYSNAAIGILDITPPESSVIASDIAVKAADVSLGFADRFSGTMIITGSLSSVESAMEEVIKFFQNTLGYVSCPITRY